MAARSGRDMVCVTDDRSASCHIGWPSRAVGAFIRWQLYAGGGTRADFKKFDADRNGELDADELEQLAEHDTKRTAEAYRQSLTTKLHQVHTLKHCTLITRLTLLLLPARKRGKVSWKTAYYDKYRSRTAGLFWSSGWVLLGDRIDCFPGK